MLTQNRKMPPKKKARGLFLIGLTCISYKYWYPKIINNYIYFHHTLHFCVFVVQFVILYFVAFHRFGTTNKE